MKNFLLILASFSLLNVHAFSKGIYTQTIRGNVTDEVTAYPLMGATVMLVGSEPKVGTVTDVEGNFELKNVPVGRQSIEISYVGYLSRTIENLLLTSAKEIVVQVSLEESTVQMDEVVVTAEKRKDENLNEMAMVSARTFSVEETERFAGSLGDPARMVANYAGVAMNSDARNDIIIRGNSPMGVLWRMEGIEIPNPNHFGALGTTGGPVSMVNNNLLTNSDFLTGAFPAEYGNATAGAFDLNMRSGNNQVHEFTGQIGFNGFELGAEGPIVKSSAGVNPSYLANFRYSTLEVMNQMGFDVGTGSAVPQYKDFTCIVDVPGTKLGRFKVFGLWGSSYIELGREAGDTLSTSYNPSGVATNYGANLMVMGLTHTYFINQNIRFKSTLSYQTTGSTAEIDSMNYRQDIALPWLRMYETENKLSFSTQFAHKISAHDNYSLGVVADFYSIDYLDSAMNTDYHRFVTWTDIKGDLVLFRTYAQWQHRFNDKLLAYGGVHVQHLNLNGETVVEPRASLKWQINDKQSVNAGFGMHSQMQPKAVYYYQTYNPADNSYTLTNEDVQFTRSNHYLLGYNFLVTRDFRFRIETYYQHLYHVPVAKSDSQFSMLNAGADFGIPRIDSLENKGTGENYGIEFTAEKFLSKGYYMLCTVSVFDSKYKGFDGVEHNTAFNGNYVVNLLAGYEHKAGKRSMFTFDVKTVWAGGKRYTPIDIEASDRYQEERRDWDQAYSKKFAAYFRTDLRIGYKINGRRVSQEWGVDLQNITNHQNIFSDGYDWATKETSYVYQQGFMPMVLYRIQF
jgi:hypothetical protein